MTNDARTKRRNRHTLEQIVKKLRGADATLAAGQHIAAVLQTLEVCEATYHRSRNQYGGMKSEEARCRNELEEENQLLQHVNSKNW